MLRKLNSMIAMARIAKIDRSNKLLAHVQYNTIKSDYAKALFFGNISSAQYKVICDTIAELKATL